MDTLEPYDDKGWDSRAVGLSRNNSVGMTPLGAAVHERCETGECTTAAAAAANVVVALLVLSGRLRLMNHGRPQGDATGLGETGEGGSQRKGET